MPTQTGLRPAAEAWKEHYVQCTDCRREAPVCDEGRSQYARLEAARSAAQGSAVRIVNPWDLFWPICLAVVCGLVGVALVASILAITLAPR